MTFDLNKSRPSSSGWRHYRAPITRRASTASVRVCLSIIPILRLVLRLIISDFKLADCESKPHLQNQKLCLDLLATH